MVRWKFDIDVEEEFRARVHRETRSWRVRVSDYVYWALERSFSSEAALVEREAKAVEQDAADEAALVAAQAAAVHRRRRAAAAARAALKPPPVYKRRTGIVPGGEDGAG